MHKLQVFVYPGDNMVFERSLYQLMEKIWRNEFVDVCTGEVRSERLVDYGKLGWKEKRRQTHAPQCRERYHSHSIAFGDPGHRGVPQ